VADPEALLRVNFCLPASNNHVRIGQQRTTKVARCAAVNLPRWLSMSAGIDGVLDKPRGVAQILAATAGLCRRIGERGKGLSTAAATRGESV